MMMRYKGSVHLLLGNSMPTDTLFCRPIPDFDEICKLGGQQKKLIHTKFQHISTIFNGVRAL